MTQAGQLKSYVMKQDYKAPYVRMTGHPGRPQQIRAKLFRKGEIVNGVMQYHKNGKPAVLMVDSVLPISLSAIREVITKEIASPAEGSKPESTSNKQLDATGRKIKATVAGAQYVDGVVIGAILGFGAMFFAEKKAWVVSTDKMNRVYSALAGAVLGAYAVYRIKK